MFKMLVVILHHGKDLGGSRQPWIEEEDDGEGKIEEVKVRGGRGILRAKCFLKI